jgi:hypothetical protein
VGARLDIRSARPSFVTLVYLYLAAVAFLFGVWVERRERTGCDRPAQSPPDESEDAEDESA